jgi:GTP cyclohydrolase I
MAFAIDRLEHIADIMRLLLKALGEDIHREGIKNTPERVARLYEDILDGNFTNPPRLATFVDENYGGIVNVHHFPFYAFCEHHLLPFYGEAAVAYIPDKKTIGLSKLVRLFRWHCKKITIQERLTNEALKTLVKLVKPKGALVHVAAEHMCMTLRGVKSPGSKTSTTAYFGELETNITLREQVLQEALK